MNSIPVKLRKKVTSLIKQLENDHVLTTKEVIEYLTKMWGEEPSINSIYYYVREGKLKPKYEDNWRIE